MGSSGKQGVLLGFWLVAIGATAAIIWHEDQFLAVSGVPIARIARAIKDVNYRGENDIRWKRINAERQGVFDGDRLATGKQSEAMIDFGDGRAAHVGPETNLTLSSIKQASGLTYILALSRGSVSIQKAKVTNPNTKTRFPIIIRSDGRDYLIEPGDERGIQRDESGVKEFIGKRGPKNSSPIAREALAQTKIDVPAAVVASLIGQSPIEPDSEPVQSMPVLEAAPPKSGKAISNPKALAAMPASVMMTSTRPIVSPSPVQSAPVKSDTASQSPAVASGVEFDISGIGREYYSFQSLSGLKGDLGTLRWKEPPAVRAILNGVQSEPAVEFSAASSRKELVLPATGNLRLKLEDFGDLKATTERDGVPCALLSIKGGVKITRGADKPNWIFKGEAREIFVCSYRDSFENLPIAVSIGSLEGSPELTRPRLFNKPSGGNLKFQMILTTPSQLAALMPIIAKNENLRIASTSGMANQGIFIARSGKVVMQLSGSGFNARNVDQLREKIGGDLVFKGSRSALLEATNLTSDELMDLVGRSDAQGRRIYLQKSGNLIPVSRKFLEERREVASFVKSVATQLFTEKVDVIAYK